MTTVSSHFQEVVAGVVETHLAARESLTPEYSQGVREGRNFFLTQLSNRVDELEGDGDLSIVRKWVMKLRKEEVENGLGDKAEEDQGLFSRNIVFLVRGIRLIGSRVVEKMWG